MSPRPHVVRCEVEVQARREIFEQMTEEALKQIDTRREWDRWWACRQNQFRTRVEARMQTGGEPLGQGMSDNRLGWWEGATVAFARWVADLLAVLTSTGWSRPGRRA